MKTRSQKSHQSATAKTHVWLTPKSITDKLGPFDLDPCSIDGHPWQIAPRWFTEEQDGLSQPWEGRVWLNPPFGDEKWDWLEKMAQHGSGIALVPACTETEGFYRTIWTRAYSACFLKGRPYFHRPDGTKGSSNSGAPIVLIAYSVSDTQMLMRANLGITLIINGAPDPIEP